MDNPPDLFLVAGEASGDIYGAELIRALRRHQPALSLLGVGGPRMAAAGMRVVMDSSGWGLIGYAEVLRHLPRFLMRLGRVDRTIRTVRPRGLVLIDFPGFNLPLARRARGRVPIVYFLPPMVSVRKGARAHRVAALGMRLLPVFPFEAAAYREAGAATAFVGHPALDRLTVPDGAQTGSTRARLGVAARAPLLALLPGSRQQEIMAHLPVMLGALGLLRERFADLTAVLPVAGAAVRPVVEEALRGAPGPVLLAEGATTEGDAALGASDFAVVASGTATVEAMCLGVPMVVVYRLSALSWWIARRIVRVSTAALPSLLAGDPVVPELLQQDFTPRRLAAVVAEWLADPARRAAQRATLLALRERLGSLGATDRAAAEILQWVGLAPAQPPDGRPSPHLSVTSGPAPLSGAPESRR